MSRDEIPSIIPSLKVHIYIEALHRPQFFKWIKNTLMCKDYEFSIPERPGWALMVQLQKHSSHCVLHKYDPRSWNAGCLMWEEVHWGPLDNPGLETPSFPWAFADLRPKAVTQFSLIYSRCSYWAPPVYQGLLEAMENPQWTVMSSSFKHPGGGWWWLCPGWRSGVDWNGCISSQRFLCSGRLSELPHPVQLAAGSAG